MAEKSRNIKDVLSPKCEEEGKTQYSLPVFGKQYIFTVKTLPIGHNKIRSKKTSL